MSVENRQFSHPGVFNAPAEGVPLELGTEAMGYKTIVMGLPDAQISVLI